MGSTLVPHVYAKTYKSSYHDDNQQHRPRMGGLDHGDDQQNETDKRQNYCGEEHQSHSSLKCDMDDVGMKAEQKLPDPDACAYSPDPGAG